MQATRTAGAAAAEGGGVGGWEGSAAASGQSMLGYPRERGSESLSGKGLRREASWFPLPWEPRHRVKAGGDRSGQRLLVHRDSRA